MSEICPSPHGSLIGYDRIIMIYNDHINLDERLVFVRSILPHEVIGRRFCDRLAGEFEPSQIRNMTDLDWFGTIWATCCHDDVTKWSRLPRDWFFKDIWWLTDDSLLYDIIWIYMILNRYYIWYFITLYMTFIDIPDLTDVQGIPCTEDVPTSWAPMSGVAGRELPLGPMASWASKQIQ